MRVLIDGQTLATPDRQRGIGVAARRICEHLVDGDPSVEWYIALLDRADIAALRPRVQATLHPVELPPILTQGGHVERIRSYSSALRSIVAQHGISVYWNPNPFMPNVVLPTDLTTVPVVATIYDLIPMVLREQYFDAWPQEWQREYRHRLAALPVWASRLVFVSESARHDYASIDARIEGKSAVVPLGVDGARYWPWAAGRDPTPPPYVLFTGGFDPRKNMRGALEAFALLVRRHAAEFSRLRFCVVCAAAEEDAAAYRRLAGTLGVADRLELTGYVPEELLARLYRSAAVFFFPSHYEGFGLPVLEAMASGVPVVAAATSSLPEVGGPHVLYCAPDDPVDMAQKLAAALRQGQGDDAEARARGVHHARQFAWTKTAAAYTRIFRELHMPRRGVAERRRRVAYVSPWLPQRSGIAAYSEDLVPELRRHVDVALFAEDVGACRGDLPLRSLADLPAAASAFDVIVYMIGNNAQYHRATYKTALHLPGIIVLHDVTIHPFLAHAFLGSADEALYEAALSEGYGAAGRAHYEEVKRTGLCDVWRFPLSLALAQRSRAVIVHSRWARNQLPGVDSVFVVSHGARSGPAAGPSANAIQRLRNRLAVPPESFIVSAVGYVTRQKRPSHLVLAGKQLRDRGYPVHLVFGGALTEAVDDPRSVARAVGIDQHVTVTGYLSDDELDALLGLSDVVVNLRFPSQGESSGTLTRALASGKPCIVTNHGPSAEYPDSVCWKVEPGADEVPLLAGCIEALLRRPEVRRQLGENAASYVAQYASLALTAERYAEVIEAVCSRASSAGGVPRS